MKKDLKTTVVVLILGAAAGLATATGPGKPGYGWGWVHCAQRTNSQAACNRCCQANAGAALPNAQLPDCLAACAAYPFSSPSLWQRILLSIV